MTHPDDIVPFQRPRTHRTQELLQTQEEIEVFGEAVANGLTNKQLAELYHCHKDTVAKYKRDPRVKAIAFKHIKDRVLRVARKVDSIIEQRLQEANELDTETLLKIRKEFLGGMAREQTQEGEADGKTIAEAQDELEKNPELAEQLQGLLDGRTA